MGVKPHGRALADRSRKRAGRQSENAEAGSSEAGRIVSRSSRRAIDENIGATLPRTAHRSRHVLKGK
jgi:hypothetical protein